MTEIIAALIGAVFGAVLAYPIGRKQGKYLVRHEKSVVVLTEIRKRLLEIRKEFEDWTDVVPDRESAQADKTMQGIDSLKRYLEDNSIVLDSKTREAVKSLADQISRDRSHFMTSLTLARLGSDEESSRNDRYKVGKEMSMWLDQDFSKGFSILDKRIRKIIGSGN